MLTLTCLCGQVRIETQKRPDFINDLITAILLLNFFLGWTMIGWIVALVWAVKTDVPMVAR